MSTTVFVSGFTVPFDLVIDKSNNIYVTQAQNNQIVKIDKNRNKTPFSSITGATGLSNIIFDTVGFPTGYLYVCDSNSTLYKLNNLGAIITMNPPITLTGNTNGIACFDSNTIWYSNTIEGSIDAVDLTTGNTTSVIDNGTFSSPGKIRFNKNKTFLYICDNSTQYISSYNLATKQLNQTFLKTTDPTFSFWDINFDSNGNIYATAGLAIASEVVIGGTQLISYDKNGTYLKLIVTDPTTGALLGIEFDSSGNLYTTNNTAVLQYIPSGPPVPPTPTPISGICFPAGTPITTNQGVINIEKLNPNKNTISNKKIIGISKTVSRDEYLILFKKHSLGSNMLGLMHPSKDTIMTKDHKIQYEGRMIEAEKFLGKFNGVTTIKYNGEFLYNILMEEHEGIYINEMICETLHPENGIARLLKSSIDGDEKRNVIMSMNRSVLTNDKVTYKKIINRLSK
jgi:streptogramin lyase